MKKFVKISLGVAVFFAVIGIISLIAAFFMGLEWNDLKDMAMTKEEYVEMETCNKLDIECPVGVVSLFYDDVDKIEVEQQGIQNFTCEMNGDTLSIRGNKGIFSDSSEASITIKIPKGHDFKEVDMEVEAGQANVDGLCAKTFSIEVGAGQANLKNIDVSHMEAQAGAGQIQAKLVGSQDEYQYDVECKLGEIVIGGVSLNSLVGKEINIEKPGAHRSLDLECGVGQIVIEFSEYI